MASIQDLVDISKIPAKVVFLILLVSSLLLFLPSFIPQLHLEEFNKEYGKFVGIIWVVSLGLFIISLGGWIVNFISNKRNKLAFEDEIKEAIRTLDPNEKAVLREFSFSNGAHTVLMPMGDPPVAGLIHKRILVQVSTIGGNDAFGIWMPFSLSDTARKNVHYTMFGIPEKPNEDELRALHLARPEWAKHEQRMKDISKGFRSIYNDF